MRSFARTLVLITALAACLPTDPCACLSPPAVVVVTGRVERADSTPATNAVTWVAVYHDTMCVTPYYNGFTGPVDSTAGFRHEVYSAVNQRQCVAVYAAPPGSSARGDSTRSASVHTFGYREPPDTIALAVIRLP